MITQCSKCNKSFETHPYKLKKHKNLFCSTECQHAFTKKRIKLTCRICNNEFETIPFRISNQIECFCSKNCADKALVVPRIKENCKSCGVEFEFLESRLKHSNRGFCSLDCFYKSQITHINKRCESCGKEFFITQSAHKDKRGRFCSKTCCNIFCKRDKSPFFKHGHGWFKKMSLDTRSEQCEVCKKIGKTDIHHKDGDQHNNIDSNFITLCRSCHTRTHKMAIKHSISLAVSLELIKLTTHLPSSSRRSLESVEFVQKALKEVLSRSL